MDDRDHLQVHLEPPEDDQPATPWWRTGAARLWLYGVGIAALPLLVGYGLLSEDQAPLWATFLASLLAITPPATAATALVRQARAGQVPLRAHERG